MQLRMIVEFFGNMMKKCENCFIFCAILKILEQHMNEISTMKD